jgi:hypothetical protein
MLARTLFAAGAVALILGFGTGTANAAPPPSAPPGFSGGQYTTGGGETVTVFSSEAYASDPAFNQAWADFLGSIPHGPEFSRLTVYLAPIAQVQNVCGLGALGCYNPEEEAIFGSGDDVPGVITAKSILAHEYGHHIEYNRSNPPFDSDNYGPKRWASFLDICAGTQRGTFFPGDESVNYKLNPAEIFAEDYRTLVERTLGLAASGWGVVDPSFMPSDAVMATVQQDVVEPWTGNTTTSFSGRFAKGRVTSRTLSLATPLDGTLRLTLRAPARSDYDLRIFDQTGRTLLAQTVLGSSARVKTLSYSICGQRSLLVRVRRALGSGPFRLSISTP